MILSHPSMLRGNTGDVVSIFGRTIDDAGYVLRIFGLLWRYIRHFNFLTFREAINFSGDPRDYAMVAMRSRTGTALCTLILDIGSAFPVSSTCTVL